MKYVVDEKIKRLDLFDERFYNIHLDDGTFTDLVSVTTFLNDYPKGYGFNQWLRMNGVNSPFILKKAQKFGKDFHSSVEALELGKSIYFENGKIELWERLMRWYEWRVSMIDKLVVSPEDIETIIYNLDLQTAGTIDLVAEKDGKKVIYDWKTGNYIGRTTDIQLAVYSYMYKLTHNLSYFPTPYIAWFPLKKPNKRGYRIIEVKNIKEKIEMFKIIQKIYFDNHKNEKPKHHSYPLTLKLKEN